MLRDIKKAPDAIRHAVINNGRVSMDQRTESSQALLEVGRPHIHQDTGWIDDRLELLRCHRREFTYGCER